MNERFIEYMELTNDVVIRDTRHHDFLITVTSKFAPVLLKIINQNNLDTLVEEKTTELLQMEGVEFADGLDDLLKRIVEPAMLRAVMRHTNNNQSQAAELMGLNRGTLRTRLKRYRMINNG